MAHRMDGPPRNLPERAPNPWRPFRAYVERQEEEKLFYVRNRENENKGSWVDIVEGAERVLPGRDVVLVPVRVYLHPKLDELVRQCRVQERTSTSSRTTFLESRDLWQPDPNREPQTPTANPRRRRGASVAEDAGATQEQTSGPEEEETPQENIAPPSPPAPSRKVEDHVVPKTQEEKPPRKKKLSGMKSFNADAEHPDLGTKEDLAAAIAGGKYQEERGEEVRTDKAHDAVEQGEGYKRYKSLTVGHHLTERGRNELHVYDPDTGEQLVIKDVRVLPRDKVQVIVRERMNSETGKMERTTEIEKVRKRFPYSLVATLRQEARNGGEVLIAHADPIYTLIPLQERRITFSTQDSPYTDIPPDGLKIELNRQTENTEAVQQWTLGRSFGNAGDPKVEARALAARTSNGEKRVEELTDEDIERYAELVDEERFPQLAHALEQTKAKALHTQIAELTDLDAELKAGTRTMEDVIRAQLGQERSVPVLVNELSDYVHGKNRVNFVFTEEEKQAGAVSLTIDPIGAKDHDDLITFQPIGDGRYEVGVHIADPTAFVAQNSPLDVISRFRCLTQYLGENVLPLFPEVLANSLCSLTAGDKRLALSVVFTIDKDGTIQGEPWIGRTLVQSDADATYQSAQQALETPGAPFHDALVVLNAMAKQQFAKREASGAIEFRRSDNLRFETGEDGEIVSGRQDTRLDTMRLIEALMVLANNTVATRLLSAAPDAISIERVHEAPELGRLESILEKIGYRDIWERLGSDSMNAREIHTLLQAVRARLDTESKPEDMRLKEDLMIRAMSKAIYRVMTSKGVVFHPELIEGEQHFGLALDAYAHFTSPIRRRIDDSIHRLVTKLLSGTPVTLKDLEELVEYLETAEIASGREIEVKNSERALVSFQGLKLLSNDIQANPDHAKVSALVRSIDRERVEVELSLPGGATMPWVFKRNALNAQESGGKLTQEEWKSLIAGKRIPLQLEVDAPLRRIAATVDTEATRKESFYDRLKPEIGGLFGARVLSSTKNQITVELTHGNTNKVIAPNLVIKREDLQQHRYRSKHGFQKTNPNNQVENEFWIKFRKDIPLTLSLQEVRSADQKLVFSFEWMKEKTVEESKEHAKDMVAQRYEVDRTVFDARISSKEENALVVTLFSKPRIRGLRLSPKRLGISMNEFNALTVGNRIGLRFRGSGKSKDGKETQLSFTVEKKNLRTPPPPRKKSKPIPKDDEKKEPVAPRRVRKQRRRTPRTQP